MTVVFAENAPPSTRGMLKRWFMEPRPNVFVGSVNAKTREKTLSYIRRNAPGIKLLVIYDAKNSQGFEILSYGYQSRQLIVKCGLTLISEICREAKNEIENR